MKISQAWSLDIMLAIIIFVATIFFFYTFLGNKQDTKIDELHNDASKVLKDILSEGDIGIVEGLDINITKLESLLNKEYSEIKRKLRIENEFCIFLEDEYGNVVYISKQPDAAGIGSDIINISQIPCG